MEKSGLMGKGRTAEVYEWGKDQVLKLFYEDTPKAVVDYEAGVGRLVSEALPVAPAVHGTVQMDHRYGILYDRVKGKSLSYHLVTNPEQGENYAKKMAELHWRIHQATCTELPQELERFSRGIAAAADWLGDKVARILDYARELSQPVAICHGDFHPDNLLVAEELVPIDWMNAYFGSPCGDVARTCLILQSPHLLGLVPQEIQAAVSQQIRLIHDSYLTEYLRLSGASQAEIEAWFLPVMAARLRERVPGEEQWLLTEINQRLATL